jgi:hypothetical protein
MTKKSNHSDKVVVHVLTTAYMSHYDQCVFVRDLATREILITTISKSS